MRIESNSFQTVAPVDKGIKVDTTVDAVVVKPVKASTEAVTANTSPKSNDSGSYSELAHKSKLELTMDEREWIEIIEKANKAINGANKSFEYSIHEQTKQIMVKVLDKDTGELIREIPPEKVLDMVARMWEMAGILVDERR